MADTVKKSRIVSDDEKDLEEALLEEFNMRLKNCMSNDDLQKDDEPPERDNIYESTSQKCTKNDIKFTEALLRSEIEHENHYDQPRSLLTNGTKQNGFNSHASEEIYENIPEKTEHLDQNYVPMVEHKKDSDTLILSIDKLQSQEYETMGLDECSSNLYESVELKPENQEPSKQTPALNLPTTLFTDYSEQKSPELDLKSSVKDRMLLSSDDTSTLLFTQTVTSPMLTPSEENIDFLKGFRRENTNSDSTASNASPPKDVEETFEQTETSPDVSEPLNEDKLLQAEENFYENAAFYKNTTPENCYENLLLEKNDVCDIDSEENIYEHVEDIKNEIKNLEADKNQIEVEEDIYQNIEEVLEEKDKNLCKDQRKSYDTDDGSLEEFIRNEREVSESFLVTKRPSKDEFEALEEEDNSSKDDNDANHVKNVTEDDVDRADDYLELIQEEQIIESTNVPIIEDLCQEANGDNKEPIEDCMVVQEIYEEIHETTNITETEEHENGEQCVENGFESITTDELSSTTETKEQISTETYKELIYHQKSETNSNYYEKYTEVLTKNNKNDVICNREKDTETVPAEIVKNLKSQFQSKGAEIVGTVKKENKAETKTVNIINQIKTKFEAGQEGGDAKNMNDSTEYSETIVETNAPGERSIKKKKVKKTRKEEKENISVNQNGNVEGESFYNVNVKSLCRSFGDLTKIDRSRNNIKNIDRMRTKSLTDMMSESNIKNVENVFAGVSVKALREIFNTNGINKISQLKVKSSFSKFDALQKKNVLHIRSTDSTKAQEKFSNGVQIEISTNCKACGKQVFQMEQIKAEKALWHKNCFRCTECSKQLTVDAYESNEGSLYCKPHFKALFAPKVVEDEAPPSDKPDLGLEELQSLNVKERFQVFEHYQTQHSETSELEKGGTPVKRSPSILSKLARFQKHGMDVGVSNEALDGIPIEESSSEEEQEEEIPEGEDPDLVRAKRVHKEKPFHFTGMSDVKKKWEHGDHAREERREETKQEIQNIRNRLFMGKQEKMKEAYQQAVLESESSSNLRKNLTEKIEACDTKSIKERFEKGEVANEKIDRDNRNEEEEEIYESEISKKSRSLFLELDASASKPPQISPVTPPKLEVKKAREAYLAKTSTEDTIKSSEQVEDIEVKTADIQERFKFFETYKEPEKQKKQFRITPPRDPSQVKTETPEREIYRDPDVVRSEEYIDDSKIAKETHTASKMLNKFRQMEENLYREPEPTGPKPLKRFTPPPEPTKTESQSEEEESSEYEDEEEEVDQAGKIPDDLVEAQKAARAKQLRAKFEKWEANEIKKEQQNAVNIVEEGGEDQSQIESTRVLRARFESMRETSSTETSRGQRIKPNRFVDMTITITEICQSCNGKVYPLEKISIHGNIYHKNCFKCMECSCVLRMDSYSYNQGLLYCTPHFKRLFITKGNYDTAFGLDQHKEKWQNNVNSMTMA